MSYIGRGTNKISNIEKLDVITFDGSSSYTLQKNSVNFTPNSANSLQVSIDGVVQAGNFTVSGSTIDFGVAIPSTSTCDFIFHYGVGVAFTPSDGTVGLAQLSATGTKDATTFLRGDNTFATAGGDNTPAFKAEASGNTSLANASWTKVNVASEIYDTDTNYDTSTSRFTPTTAGKYQFSLNCEIANGGTFNTFQIALYKNGTRVSNAKTSHFYSSGDSQYRTQNLVLTYEANGSTDYFEMYAYHDAGSSINALSGSSTYFEAHKLIGV